MRPCSKYWLVVQVTYTHFQVAFQTADTGYDSLIDQALLSKIVSTIVHLNKIQNQEFLLHEIVESKLCPKELLHDHTPALHGNGMSLCTVHTHFAPCTLTLHSAHSLCTVHTHFAQCTLTLRSLFTLSLYTLTLNSLSAFQFHISVFIRKNFVLVRCSL